MTRQLALTCGPFLSQNSGICLHTRLLTTAVLFIFCLNARQLGQRSPTLCCCATTSPPSSDKISVLMTIYYSITAIERVSEAVHPLEIICHSI